MIYGQLSWHSQPCKATAVFCINTSGDVFPQPHPVSTTPTLLLLPATTPSLPPSFCSYPSNVMGGPIDWTWDAVETIHHSQVERHSQVHSTQPTLPLQPHHTQWLLPKKNPMEISKRGESSQEMA